MSTQSWKKHRLVVGALVLGCLFVDAAVLFAVGYGIIWLLGATSPYIWAGVAVAVVLAARTFRMLRWVRNAHRLAAGLDVSVPKQSALWSDAPAG